LHKCQFTGKLAIEIRKGKKGRGTAAMSGALQRRKTCRRWATWKFRRPVTATATATRSARMAARQGRQPSGGLRGQRGTALGEDGAAQPDADGAAQLSARTATGRPDSDGAAVDDAFE